MGVDDGDPLGDDPRPDACGSDLGPDAAHGGAGVGEDEAPLGASPLAESAAGPLDAHATSPWDGDSLPDLWATDSGPDTLAGHSGDSHDQAAGIAGAEHGAGPHDDAQLPNDTDEPAGHVADSAVDTPDDHIHLDIDDTAADLDDQPAVDPDPSDLPDALQAPLLGLTPPEVTEHSLAALGVAPSDFDAALARMGVVDPELGLDGRTVGIAMGEVGVDAVVEHAGLDDLVTLVSEGRQVLLTGPPDAPVLLLADVDLAGGSCVVEDVATGAQHVVGLDVVESSWAASGYQVVTGSTSGSSTDVPAAVSDRGGASVAVIQAVIAAWQ